MTAYGVATTKSGRAGIAFPLDWLLKITTFGMTLIICGISLIVWPIYAYWHQFCWAVTIFAIYWYVRKAYKKARS
jgi:Flp pilus assembly protein TadB